MALTLPPTASHTGAPPPPPPAGRLLSPPWLHHGLGINVTLERTDRMRWATRLTLLTLVTAIVCALLGRIPVDLPMPTHLIGAVCPTCGLTRGTVAITRGHFALAFRYNPLSFAVPLAALLVMTRLVLGTGFGRWVNVRYRPTRLAWTLGAIALAALWGYQQAHAAFIMHSHVV